jgi:hypothetical protein
MIALRHAFKEWAVICRALALGRQAIVLRKGGIAENSGEFQLEHTRFWLYPTYVHQQKDGVTSETAALFDEVESERPPQGIVRLSHFAEVKGVYHVHDPVGALRLAGMHGWSHNTVRKRFEYRRPGLYVLPVRVYRSLQSYDLPETDEFAGCRSWVELERELPTEGATPVLDDAAFDEVLRTLDRLLEPTAFA